MLTIILVAATAIVVLAILLKGEPVVIADRIPVAHSPLEQAEQILAQRYAREEITAEQYERMLVLLRH